MENNNVLTIKDQKTAIEEGVKKGRAIARSIITDGEFEANIDNVAAWAESINLDMTVGNAYSIIAIAIVRCLLGNELFDMPLETADGNFSDEAVDKGKNAILDKLGLKIVNGEVTVRMDEYTDE